MNPRDQEYLIKSAKNVGYYTLASLSLVVAFAGAFVGCTAAAILCLADNIDKTRRGKEEGLTDYLRKSPIDIIKSVKDIDKGSSSMSTGESADGRTSDSKSREGDHNVGKPTPEPQKGSEILSSNTDSSTIVVSEIGVDDDHVSNLSESGDALIAQPVSSHDNSNSLKSEQELNDNKDEEPNGFAAEVARAAGLDPKN